MTTTEEEVRRLLVIAEHQRALIDAMCAGKVHPSCPGCANLRRERNTLFVVALIIILGLTFADTALK